MTLSGPGVGPARPEPCQRISGWRALRRDPTHAPEIAVLYALPLLSPSIARHASALPPALTEDDRTRLARATVRRSAGLSRRFGIITGSSFYVGMAPALTVTYIEQIIVILRMATIYGHDPANPARAAEILYLQGRHRTVGRAQAALSAATTGPPNNDRPSRWRALKDVIRQLPSMLDLRLLHWATLAEAILNILKIVALLIPVISIPLWVFVNGRSANKIGSAAAKYYALPHAAVPTADLTLPSPPSRRRVVTALITTALVLAALAAVVPLGSLSHRLPLGGVILAETGLAFSMYRLLLVTRPGKPQPPQEKQLATCQDLPS